jgi:hypothetical protein
MLLLFPEMMRFPQEDEKIFVFQRFNHLLMSLTREQKEQMIKEAKAKKIELFQHKIIQ